MVNSVWKWREGLVNSDKMWLIVVNSVWKWREGLVNSDKMRQRKRTLPDFDEGKSHSKFFPYFCPFLPTFDYVLLLLTTSDYV